MNLSKAWTAQLDDYAIDLAWSPDGSLLAVASAAGPVTLFDGANGAKRHELPGHTGGTNAVAWAPAFQKSEVSDQKSGAADLTSDLWSLTSGLLASGGQDGCVRFWDADAGTQIAETALGRDWIEQLAWRPEVGRVIPNAPTVNEETRRANLTSATGGRFRVFRVGGARK
jgi:WD40 repeat protein